MSYRTLPLDERWRCIPWFYHIGRKPTVSAVSATERSKASLLVKRSQPAVVGQSPENANGEGTTSIPRSPTPSVIREQCLAALDGGWWSPLCALSVRAVWSARGHAVHSASHLRSILTGLGLLVWLAACDNSGAPASATWSHDARVPALEEEADSGIDCDGIYDACVDHVHVGWLCGAVANPDGATSSE